MANKRFVLWLTVAVAAVADGRAADPLRLELSTVTSNLRSDAPLTLNVHLDWASPNLLEGRLELSCYDGNTLLHRNVGSDVALLAGDRYSRTVLPPMQLSGRLSALTVNARFLTETKVHDLGSIDVRVPVSWRRSFVIGVLVPYESARIPGSTEMGQSLRLDRLGVNEITDQKLVSLPSRITPDDLQTSTLGLFSFDLLALTAPGFKTLGQSQLDAIAGWVEAGGSLVVSIDDTNSPRQIRFLNRIAGVPENEPGMLLTTDGYPPGGIAERRGRLRMYRPGLGRSVILGARGDAGLSAIPPEAAAFLWKLRKEIQSEFRNRGTSRILSSRLLETNNGQEDSWQSGSFNDSDFRFSPFQRYRLKSTDSLTSVLLPDEVQSIPLSAVAIILCVFLAVIVPIDYYVLGFFNGRRFTWLLVPLVSLIFTSLTTAVGKAYLGSSDYRTSLDFVDLSNDNRVARTTRFQMLFTATQREVTTELRQTLYTPFRVNERSSAPRSSNGFENYRRRPVPTDTIEQGPASESPESIGNMPTLFTVRQQMRKWSPQISRQTLVKPEYPIPQFDLDAIEASWRESPDQAPNAAWQQELRAEVESVVPDATVLIFWKNQVLSLTQTGDVSNAGARADAKQRLLLELVKEASARPAIGMFSVVSQISPNGADNFEDLSVVDFVNGDELLVVIIARRENDYIVYRRPFHRGS